MKRIYLLAMTAFLFSGVSFAGNGGDKGKDKAKKTQSTPKPCPGKQCGKKQG